MVTQAGAIIGPNLDRGMRPQLVIPANTFHMAKLATGQGWALMGTTSWPQILDGALELADIESLCAQFPNAAKLITAFPS